MPCSIQNVVRVTDVPQDVPVNTFKPVKKTFHCDVVRTTIPRNADMGCHPVSKEAADDGSDPIKSLVAVFANFLRQLISLFSDNNKTTVPDVSPLPQVQPRIVPDPPSPSPSPSPAPAPAITLPDLSKKRNGAKPDNIWSGFRQGPDGNCVTVSAIKVAMYRFGQSPTDIFKSVSKTNEGYRVVMRDEFQLTLTGQELAQAAQHAQFNGQDRGMLKDAQFLFAASAKRAQMENNDGTAGRSFHAAIRSLNNGEDERGPGEGLLRLGLKQHMKRVSVRDLARGQLGMCNRTGHSVAVINGREELWGRRGSFPTRGQAVALV